MKSGWSGWREKEVVRGGRKEEKRKRTLGKRERAVVLRAESMTSGIMERIWESKKREVELERHQGKRDAF